MSIKWCKSHIAILVALILLYATTLHANDPATSPDLTHLSIEDLMNLEVISTTKQTQRLSDAAAAVFVITQEDIRRSGVTNIPDALRMVPGVQVAQIDSNKWAITVRGFNGRFADKLLVLVDGRTIYTPLFSGVYWEIQDLLLEDIDHIEVIRGPGASLWGANAVNGIINIITKHTTDTQGGLVSLTAGNQERPILGLRYGGQLGDNGHYRVYGKYLNEAGLVDSQGKDAGDNWHLGSGGFRLDWAPSAQNTLMVQGDLYNGDLHQNLTVPAFTPPFAERDKDTAKISGGNVQARWQHTFSPSSQMTLQSYFQQEKRTGALQDAELNTFDLDFQHSFALGERHEFLWGLGYRLTSDDFKDTKLSIISPPSRLYNLFSAFIQDQVTLLPNLGVAIGTKLEHNDFTGWEIQPSARLLWTFHPKHRLWAAVSRAVHTPSRADSDLRLNLFTIPPTAPGRLPSLFTAQGDKGLGSEKLIAYELGYRIWFIDRLSLDMVAFYQDYDDLRSIKQGMPFLETRLGAPHVTVPLLAANDETARTYGFELAADWRPLNRWRLQLAYTYLNSKEYFPTLTGSKTTTRGANPPHQISLLSSLDIRQNLELDLWLRYVDVLPEIRTRSQLGSVKIDPYFALNLRLGWRPRRDVEFSLVGTNLFDAKHLEYIQEAYPFPTQVVRSIYGQLKWSF